MFENPRDIDNLLKKHLSYRESCLNLIASENYASEFVRGHQTSDLSNRYGCYETGNPQNREYTGNRYIHEFEMQTQALVCDIFHAKYADLRPISGHLAGMAVALALLEVDDLVIEVSLADWGHGMVGPMCDISQLGKTIRIDYMPFDKNGGVDFDGLVAQVRELKPKLVIFGGSGTLFAEPVKAFRPVADELNILVGYDAAHVTGLIAGGAMPNPLDEGADVMFGSTHKSFPGPQGGFVVSNRADLMDKIGKTISPSLVTSHHIHRLPALAAAILEMKAFGADYAAQIVKNTKALSKALDAHGFKIRGKERGYSDTHIILLETDGGGQSVAKRLEMADILLSDDFSGSSSDVRLGTQEATRRGMKEKEMEEIALLIKRVMLDGESPEAVRGDVGELSRRFNGLEYCF
ncbi:MAG: aminotransferase class I/II-fold pyridoxal phosphate-dependent enzyme [Oscillospiraceae bacterium]|nr:aminotransferase class I/II-fold pyridoxal phosphate-dependent enzyme [Oscillospiraceae bacterium]